MSKKRKLRRLNATKLNKEKARERIGQPPPSRPMSSGKGKVLRRITVEASPEIDTRKDFIKISGPKPEEEKTPVYMKSPERITSLTPKQWPSTGRTQPGVKFSEEVVQHADFLRKSSGEEEVNRYLNQVRSNYMDGQQAAGGTLEGALREATAKATYHTQEASKHTAEAQKWGSIKQKLEDALQLYTTPARSISFPSGEATGTRRTRISTPFGFWNDAIIAHFRINPEPIKRSGLMHNLHALKPDLAETSVYGPIAKAVDTGMLQKDAYGLLSPGPNFPSKGDQTKDEGEVEIS